MSKDLAAEKFSKLFSTYSEAFELVWEDKKGQAEYMIDQDAEAAHELGNSIIQKLGL
jgi:hypothetical protein